MMRVLLIGARGRLGAALARVWGRRYHILPVTRTELDVSDPAALEAFLCAESWDVVVNASGATSLEACEDDPALACRVNADAPAVMARKAADFGRRLIHFGTDYVFDGRLDRPYREDDPTNPLSVYGKTKRDGERAVVEASDAHVCVRVSWVFGPDRPSFIDAMLRRAREEDEIDAVGDKTSCPAFSEDLAEWLQPFLESLPGGIYHACNGGICSWSEFAQVGLDIAHELGWKLRARTVRPIPMASVAAFRAVRPVHTPMDCGKLTATTGIQPRPWQEALRAYLAGCARQ
jgi:dTDP-4-dehydrorhamnose reductase